MRKKENAEKNTDSVKKSKSRSSAKNNKSKSSEKDNRKRLNIHKIRIYCDEGYYGDFPLSKVQELMKVYHGKALKYLEKIDWDEVILYAVFRYDRKYRSQTFVEAHFMLERMTYTKYKELWSGLSKDYRLFFLSGLRRQK